MPGRAGITRATVHSVFSDRLKALRAESLAQSLAFSGDGPRPWQVPEQLQDLLKVPDLHKPTFDRTSLNENYQECIQSIDTPGTTGDVIALKQQLDYNAVEERAFRLRHASLVRCLTHGAGRRRGLGRSAVFSNVEKQVSNAIANGGA